MPKVGRGEGSLRSEGLAAANAPSPIEVTELGIMSVAGTAPLNPYIPIVVTELGIVRDVIGCP